MADGDASRDDDAGTEALLCKAESVEGADHVGRGARGLALPAGAALSAPLHADHAPGVLSQDGTHYRCG